MRTRWTFADPIPPSCWFIAGAAIAVLVMSLIHG